MNKAICFGKGFDFYQDLPMFVKKGFNALFLTQCGLDELANRVVYALQNGIKIFIVDIAGENWKQVVDTVNAQYYYYDEPYLKNIPEKELTERAEYIKQHRFGSKFVIGDVRKIQAWNYKPLDDVYYTYTSYTNNIYIPFLGFALPIGLGNQSPSIRRIHKKFQYGMPFIWVYGNNKLLCHPDEYHKLRRTCDSLGIKMMVLYLLDSEGKYKFNEVSREQMLEYIDHFIADTKPYTIKEWWDRLFYRLHLSLRELTQNWNFKEFIEHLF